jgi:hypothetical protein
MDEHAAEPKNDGELRDSAAEPALPRRAWETPALEELSVQLTAALPRVGGDGSTPFVDCTHT